MRFQEWKEKLNAQLSEQMPDVREKVRMRNAAGEKVSIAEVPSAPVSRRSNRQFYALAAAMVALVFVCLMIFMPRAQSYAELGFNSSGSVRICVDEKAKVTKVEALDADGKVLLAELDLVGQPLLTALYQLSAKNTAILAENSIENCILYLLPAVDTKEGRDLLNSVIAEYKAAHTDITVRTEVAESSLAAAKEYNVSASKYELMLDVYTVHAGEYTMQELAQLSMRTLIGLL